VTVAAVNTIEIAIHGRGGQAAITTGNILTYALFLEGMSPHGQPRFTPDRMGAPVSYAIRFNKDRTPIWDRSWIRKPQIVLLFDLTLIGNIGVNEVWEKGIEMIANIPQNADIPEKLLEFKLYVVDANRIAQDCGLMKGCVPILSSAMAGAFAKATGLVSLQSVESAMKALGKGALERYLPANIEALRRGYEEVRRV
jgi:2-oxoacid:acceptor oxidoreductase gamma subunit (pyruvate/2-ketoisovalerate family)